MAESPQVALTRAQGIAVIEEAFPDRAYQANGALLPRSQAGAVLDDPERVKAQAAALMRMGPIECIDGSSLVVHAQTLCVHGDTPKAWPMLGLFVWPLRSTIGTRLAERIDRRSGYKPDIQWG